MRRPVYLNRRARIAGLAITGFLLLIEGIYFHPHAHRPPSSAPTGFPVATAREIKGFHRYYFGTALRSNYRLQTNTVSYQNGVLLFSLRNPAGATLVFTEEATPPGYTVSQLHADRQFQTGYGKAFITDAATRTTGALFTTDGTWVLINAPQPIGADLMQEILNALQPQT